MTSLPSHTQKSYQNDSIPLINSENAYLQNTQHHNLEHLLHLLNRKWVLNTARLFSLYIPPKATIWESRVYFWFFRAFYICLGVLSYINLDTGSGGKIDHGVFSFDVWTFVFFTFLTHWGTYFHISNKDYFYLSLRTAVQPNALSEFLMSHDPDLNLHPHIFDIEQRQRQFRGRMSVELDPAELSSVTDVNNHKYPSRAALINRFCTPIPSHGLESTDMYQIDHQIPPQYANNKIIPGTGILHKSQKQDFQNLEGQDSTSQYGMDDIANLSAVSALNVPSTENFSLIRRVDDQNVMILLKDLFIAGLPRLENRMDKFFTWSLFAFFIVWGYSIIILCFTFPYQPTHTILQMILVTLLYSSVTVCGYLQGLSGVAHIHANEMIQTLYKNERCPLIYIYRNYIGLVKLMRKAGTFVYGTVLPIVIYTVIDMSVVLFLTIDSLYSKQGVNSFLPQLISSILFDLFFLITFLSPLVVMNRMSARWAWLADQIKTFRYSNNSYRAKNLFWHTVNLRPVVWRLVGWAVNTNSILSIGGVILTLTVALSRMLHP